jgi:hypothetical protein
MGDERALLGLLFVPSRMIETNKEHINDEVLLGNPTVSSSHQMDVGN